MCSVEEANLVFYFLLILLIFFPFLWYDDGVNLFLFL